MVEGLKQLKNLGYVHRDLKPENIVLNLAQPLRVALIDFGTAILLSAETKGSKFGTLGYYPEKSCKQWKDASEYWDLWAMGAIIMEADMPFGKYKNTYDE